jgi:hypothetical protein
MKSWKALPGSIALFAAAGGVAAVAAVAAGSAVTQSWPQWGQNPQHTGAVSTPGQPARALLADVVSDPFTAQERADPFATPDLVVHYQAPLLDGDDVFLELKSGTYTSLATWETQTWNEERLHWEQGALVRKWVFQSDWKPVPWSGGVRGPSWEPVFHAALAGDFIYVPGFGGTVYKLAKDDGALVAHLNPFRSKVDPDTFLTGPITADAGGNIYYGAIKVDPAHPWDGDVVNSWLVKVTAGGAVESATYRSLTPGAPDANDRCFTTFSVRSLPWPPSPGAVPPTERCGAQRVAVNSAPAVAPDGTIYAASVAHLSRGTAYLLAVNPDLTPKWQASLRDRFKDGCNVLIPPNGTPGGCRAGARTGVDPAQNRPGAGWIHEDSTASPVVAPDGSVLFGVFTRYNYLQGHLMKFSSRGEFLAAYPFGWDDTPAIYAHGGSYSVLTKENHYSGIGSYCDDPVLCPSDRTASNPASPEAYFITQLSSRLVPEWRYRNTNTLACSRDAKGRITCVPGHHPAGFEWCINAPAVDGNGVVYANSEDGGLYAIEQGGALRDHLFLVLAVGAAYTPVAIGADGRIYTENDGHLLVVGR